VKYIPDLTKGNVTRSEISELETKLEHLSTRLDQLKQQKQDHLKHLQQEKDKLLKEIRILRKQINDKLDKMEKSLVDDVNLKFVPEIQSTNQSVDTIVNMKASVETSQKNIQEAKQSNEAELFVQLKRGNSSLQTHENTFYSLRSAKGARSVKLLPSNDIKKLLTLDEISLGHISETLVAKSTVHHGDFSVRVQSDKSTCKISGICLTTNGSVIIIDNENKRIKKLDDSYAVIEHLDMADPPGCLCELDSTKLAVTVRSNKKVQFVSQQPLRLGTSFPVGDGCRGITCLHGQLYVCCGGWREKGEGPGHIEVYNMTGVLLRTFYEGLSFPGYISATGEDELFISEDDKSNLMRVSMTSYLVSEMQIKKLSYPAGLCRIGDGQLCIAGNKSNNIVLVSEDGGEQQELLTKKDGTVEPFVVCFDEKHSRLIVSLYKSEAIKVFNLFT
jgi:ribosome-associated translation inhibitor RaiA